MKSSKTFRTLCLALACAASFSLAVSAQAQTVTFVTQFTGNLRAATGVVQATDGNFYGTDGGGANSRGDIFRMTPSGKVSTIYSFCSEPNCSDGEYPNPTPVLGSDGNLYGTAPAGANGPGTGFGTFFKMTLGGKLTTLYSFCPSSPCDDGVSPNGVVLASDGNFYGTTPVAGKSDAGTIFQISPTGQFKLLYTFCSSAKCADGGNPGFPPIQGRDGNFYGTTSTGGTNEGGVVYELTPSGTYTVLHNFCAPNDNTCKTGAVPSQLVQDTNGNFFGTTSSGVEVVFEFTSKHQYLVLHTFHSTAGGTFPSGLTLANDGNFYGTTAEGGTAGDGTVFEMTPSGKFTSLYSFSSSNGYNPAGTLFQGTNGNVYGATEFGAPACCFGTIFRLSNNFSPLVETVPVAGKVGKQIIILGNGLTGTTSVKFNGKAATFTVVSGTEIKATVPSGATTGTVSVVTPTGTLNSNPQFVVTK
jgi:uncharacterized repeat protein (TIGR03803 family)